MNHTNRKTIEVLLNETANAIAVPSREQFGIFMSRFANGNNVIGAIKNESKAESKTFGHVTKSPFVRYTGYGNQVYLWFHSRAKTLPKLLPASLIASTVISAAVLVMVLLPQSGTVSIDSQQIITDEGQQELVVITEEDRYADVLVDGYINHVLSVSEYY